MSAGRAMSFGFPRTAQEPGELRDFLPDVIAAVANLGCPVVVEAGLGSGMHYRDEDYLAASPLVRTGDERETFGRDVVLILRAPDERMSLMRPGATLISMLHFPTRPARVQRLTELGIEAISLDSIVDDEGRRLVENMRAVAWNGVDAAFAALERNCPWLEDRYRWPVRVTVIGAGAVGKHAIEAATKYGSLERNARFTSLGVPGVEVTVLGRNLTGHIPHLRRRLAQTDLLVDASNRSDPTKPLVRNHLLSLLPDHAVICDLVVDPYLPDAQPATVRSIEGIPQGDLDQWTFQPDDPRWCATVPPGVPTEFRRTVVSCRAWPGIKPEECMRHYARQLIPLLSTLVDRGGVEGLRSDGGAGERALRRAWLRHWSGDVGVLEAAGSGVTLPTTAMSP
jgi:alanine dehydrogenase